MLLHDKPYASSSVMINQIKLRMLGCPGEMAHQIFKGVVEIQSATRT